MAAETAGERRVALVTGAATVRKLAAAGHAVAFCARDPARVEHLAAEAAAGGEEVLGIVADMSDADSIDAFLERAVAALGPADVLVNNVGQSPSRNFLRMSDDDWRALFDLNLLAAVRCTRAVLPAMRARMWGRIVMVGSAAAKLPSAPLVDYAASKAAMLATAKALARRYGRDGVLVNSVLPGLIHTPMWERAAGEIAAATDSTPEAVIEKLGAEVPVGRYGTPAEVAEVIAFLAGDGASYVNGAAFDVDGGSNPHIL